MWFTVVLVCLPTVVGLQNLNNNSKQYSIVSGYVLVDTSGKFEVLLQLLNSKVLLLNPNTDPRLFPTPPTFVLLCLGVLVYPLEDRKAKKLKQQITGNIIFLVALILAQS